MHDSESSRGEQEGKCEAHGRQLERLVSWKPFAQEETATNASSDSILGLRFLVVLLRNSAEGLSSDSSHDGEGDLAPLIRGEENLHQDLTNLPYYSEQGMRLTAIKKE